MNETDDLKQLIKQLIEMLQEHAYIMIENNNLLREYQKLLKDVVDPTKSYE